MKYFTIKELTRSTTAQLRGIDNTPSQQVINNLTALVENVLDPLREAWGAPIHVNSGYRCPALNKAVSGVPASQHMLGEAADITAGSKTKTNASTCCFAASICPLTKPSTSMISAGYT